MVPIFVGTRMCQQQILRFARPTDGRRSAGPRRPLRSGGPWLGRVCTFTGADTETAGRRVAQPFFSRCLLSTTVGGPSLRGLIAQGWEPQPFAARCLAVVPAGGAALPHGKLAYLRRGCKSASGGVYGMPGTEGARTGDARRGCTVASHPAAKNAEGWGTPGCALVEIAGNKECATRPPAAR